MYERDTFIIYTEQYYVNTILSSFILSMFSIRFMKGKFKRISFNLHQIIDSFSPIVRVRTKLKRKRQFFSFFPLQYYYIVSTRPIPIYKEGVTYYCKLQCCIVTNQIAT